MIRLVLLLILLFASPTWADELIPGSYRIEYGGLYKVAADESVRFLQNRWRDQEFQLWRNEVISFGMLTRRNIRMVEHLNDWRYGPPWWTREWWHSLETHKGGAPPNRSIIIKKGSDFSLIDTPIFSISNSFSLRWKSLQATVDFKSKRPIMFSVGSVPAPRFGWKFKVAPEFKFSTIKIFSDPMRGIRRVGFRLVATHWIRKPIVSIEVRAWYSPLKRRGFIGVRFILLQW